MALYDVLVSEKVFEKLINAKIPEDFIKTFIDIFVSILSILILRRLQHSSKVFKDIFELDNTGINNYSSLANYNKTDLLKLYCRNFNIYEISAEAWYILYINYSFYYHSLTFKKVDNIDYIVSKDFEYRLLIRNKSNLTTLIREKLSNINYKLILEIVFKYLTKKIVFSGNKHYYIFNDNNEQEFNSIVNDFVKYIVINIEKDKWDDETDTSSNENILETNIYNIFSFTKTKFYNLYFKFIFEINNKHRSTLITMFKDVFDTYGIFMYMFMYITPFKSNSFGVISNHINEKIFKINSCYFDIYSLYIRNFKKKLNDKKCLINNILTYV